MLDPLQLRVRIVLGLVLDGGDILAQGFFLGLQDAYWLSIDEKNEVCRAAIRSVFADGLAFSLVEVDAIFVLNGPAGEAELGVDSVAGLLLGILVGHL